MEVRRRWVLAPVVTQSVAPDAGVVLRATTPEDDEQLARLLDDAYTGSDDVDDDTDHDEELRGLAAAVLRAALAELAARESDLLAGWVTVGNEASETLLATHGFVPVTPPMRQAQAIGLYRAARAVRELGVPVTAAIAVASDDTGPTLYVVEEEGPSSTVDVDGTSVRVERLGEDDPRVTSIADTAVPLRRAAWLLARRSVR